MFYIILIYWFIHTYFEYWLLNKYNIRQNFLSVQNKCSKNDIIFLSIVKKQYIVCLEFFNFFLIDI